MKIGGHLITSLASYRKHFDFNSVWFQLDIFLRDMSPMRMPYLKENEEDHVAQSIFYAIASPNKVKIENGSLLYFSDDVNPFEILSINAPSSIELSSLKEYKLEDKVRIILLHELANKKISDESMSQGASSSKSNGEILLFNGSTLKVVEGVSTGMRLFIKPISVDRHSSCSSIIDGYELSPGKTAYGIFSDSGFHRLLPPTLQNEKYLIRLRTDSASPEMVVRDKKDGTVSHFHNVVSFCTIRDNNYIYIQNQMVYSHHDEGLAKRLKSAIGFFGTPLFIHTNNEYVFITMADGTITKVEL